MVGTDGNGTPVALKQSRARQPKKTRGKNVRRARIVEAPVHCGIMMQIQIPTHLLPLMQQVTKPEVEEAITLSSIYIAFMSRRHLHGNILWWSLSFLTILVACLIGFATWRRFSCYRVPVVRGNF
jgi:hypothetical protein